MSPAVTRSPLAAPVPRFGDLMVNTDSEHPGHPERRGMIQDALDNAGLKARVMPGPEGHWHAKAKEDYVLVQMADNTPNIRQRAIDALRSVGSLVKRVFYHE